MSVFSVIVADPPWDFNDKLKKMKGCKKRSAASQYGVFSTRDIVTLDVNSLANPNGCLLALWVPGAHLKNGILAMEMWGFNYKQMFVWTKLKKDYKNEPDPNKMTRVGMGRIFRQSHETALIGTMGKVYKHLKDHSQRSVAFDLNKGHSIKPETLQDRLEIMFPNVERLEMFARRIRPGWTCIGDEIDGKDIRDAIQDLRAL